MALERGFTVESVQADLTRRLPEDIESTPIEELERIMDKAAEEYRPFGLTLEFELECESPPLQCRLKFRLKRTPRRTIHSG